MVGVTLEYLFNIKKYIEREEIINVPISQLIFFKEVMDDITIPSPPALQESCTGFNCICWKYNRRGCSEYNLCIKCHSKFSKCDCIKN